MRHFSSSGAALVVAVCLCVANYVSLLGRLSGETTRDPPEFVPPRPQSQPRRAESGSSYLAPAQEGVGAVTTASPNSSNFDAQRFTSDRNISVVSMSLYGNSTRYFVPLLYSAENLVPKFYPGWQLRIYHDSFVPLDTLSQLRDLPHVRLVNVASMASSSPDPLLRSEWSEWLPRANPMSWRFMVASDPHVDAYVVRDSDSLIGPREKAAVDEWLQSGAAFHVMHDHPHHYAWSNKNITMMGGMWGGRGGRLPRDMAAMLKAWYDDPFYWKNPKTGTFLKGDDQNFLAWRVWPLVKSLGPTESVRHNSFHCELNDGVAFPAAGKWDFGGYDYVGGVVAFDSDDRGGWKLRGRDHRKSGACRMKYMMFLRTVWRKLYRQCMKRRELLGFRNASDVVKEPPPPPTGCVREDVYREESQ